MGVIDHHPRKLAAALFAAVLTILALPSSAFAQRVSQGVPILLYHRFGPVVPDAMTVRTEVFEEQLAWLRDHDYQIVPLKSLVASLRDASAALPARAVAITADDGHKSVYTEMFPLIERYRFPVTLFIYPSAISNASYALTWQQLAEMMKTGLVDVQSHTYWHPNFNDERKRRSPADYRSFVMTQLTRSKEVLEKRLGGSVDMLAWPFGIFDPELEQWAALAGYSAAVTLERRPARRGDDLLALPRYLITDLDRGDRFAAIVEAAAPSRAQP